MIKIIFSIIVIMAIIAPIALFAQDYRLLEPLPGLPGSLPVESGFSQYLGWVYKFAIAAAIFLAVLMIVIGGIQIIAGGASETARSNAKKRIKDAILGLLLVLIAYLILYWINPDLVTGRFNIPTAQIRGAPPPTPTPTPSPGITFNNNPSTELSNFMDCMINSPWGIRNLRITSTTDNNIATGACNPTDPNELFNNRDNCQHRQYSCHYGGHNCITRGSFAIDVGITGTDGTNIAYRDVARVAADCGARFGSHDLTARCKNESSTSAPHYHLSIGPFFMCGCDTSMTLCAAQD
ncbi:MAG: hypothetical protein AB1643_01045 [Patescibacteria group bacterium]